MSAIGTHSLGSQASTLRVEADASFADYANRVSRQNLRLMGWFALGLLVVFAPTDLISAQVNAETTRSMTALRLFAVPLMLAVLALEPRLTWLHRRPIVLTGVLGIIGVYVLAFHASTWFVPSEPWIYGIYVVPFTTTPALAPLTERIVAAVLNTLPWAAAALVGTWSSDLIYVFWPQLFLLFSMIAAIVVGHVTYLGARRTYSTRAELKRETDELNAANARLESINQQLVELNTELEERVDSKSDELRDLSKRIAALAEEDRAFIAQDLHDEFGQVVAGLRMQLGLSGTVSDRIAYVSEIRGLLDRMTTSLNRTLHQLRPTELETMHLADALAWLVSGVAQQSGLHGGFECEGDSTRVPDELAHHVFRVTQEALTNVVRHAEASRVDVGLRVGTDDVRLRILDDGVGVDDSAGFESYGLNGMRRRAAAVGGTVTVNSGTDSGTMVELHAPLGTTAAREETG